MATCKQCREFEKCKDDAFINGAKFNPNESVKYCTGFEPITNADRIRAMSDEELAWELMTWRLETEAKRHGVESNYPNTQASILEWLKHPAKQKSYKKL